MGEVFAGRFELLEPVAEGGMGSVWQVRDLRDDQVYAGKVLRQSDAGSLLRFMREQSTRVEHPHVVTPLSWAGEDDRVMFTMPLVRGGSVATLLGDVGPLPAPWVVALLDQTLQALEAVHRAGIVHRDVKPANLLLDATGTGTPHVRLTDFGVAVPIDAPRLTEASQVVGTRGYGAPDYVDGGADPEPGHDLHAVAAVGLELVSAVPPPGAVPAARARAEREPDLAALVGLLVGVVEGRRPASAAAFRDDLARLGVAPLRPDPEGPEVFDQFDGAAAAAPVEPTPTVARPRPAPPPESRRYRTAGLVLVAAGVVCALAAIALLLA